MNYENEIWVPVYGNPRYEISNYGRVRNFRTKLILATRQDGKQYRMVNLWDGKVQLKRIARMVWQSFNGCDCGMTIDHINHDPADDRLENLQCISMEDNWARRKEKGQTAIKNKYDLTDWDKGYIHRSITGKTETTWTIMKKYGIPINYLQTTIKRGSWAKFA